MTRAREAAASMLGPDASGTHVCARITDATDTWLAALWRASAPDLVAHSSLWALGGYGRQELSFFSDLDLLVCVHPDALTPDAHAQVERFMRWVRLTRLELRHAVRTHDQILESLEQDPRTPISMLDARLVLRGDHADDHAHPRDVALPHLRASNQGRALTELLIEGMRARHSRAGSTVYMLEPQLKIGVGGLRDLHALRWSSLVRFGLTPEELRDAPAWSEYSARTYSDSLEWLLRARHTLHHALARKNDRLRFAEQELLATRLTTPDGTPISSRVEGFMRDHYHHTRAAERLTRRALTAWRRPAQRPDPSPLSDTLHQRGNTLSTTRPSPHPLALALDAVTLAHRHGLSLDPDLERALHESQPQWARDLEDDPSLATRVGALLTDVQAPPERSHTLLELGILTAVIPEFTPLVCHVHHDTFHVYTTDEHSLRCLERARTLLAGRPDPIGDRWAPLRELATRVDPTLLLLAALLHDVGKNRGGDHSRVGAELVPPIIRRLGLPDALSSRLSFLVLEHLSLTQAAKRHDIGSREVLDPLATRIGDLDTLDTLTLLTFCDSSTIAPEGIDDWHASLLLGLHNGLRRRLEADATHHAALERVAQSSPAFRALHHDLQAQTLARFEHLVPDQDAPLLDPDTLARQIDLFTRWLDTQTPQAQTTTLPERGHVELIVCARPHTHTLSSLSGALGAHGLQLLSARITQADEGPFLGIFQLARQTAHHYSHVPRPKRVLHHDLGLKTPIAEIALEALDAPIEDVARRVAARLSETRTHRPRGLATDVSVRVTRRGRSGALAEVRASDRLALFYDLCRALDALDARVCFAKLDALGHRILDTLHLEPTSTERFSRAQLDALEAALTRAATSYDAHHTSPRSQP